MLKSLFDSKKIILFIFIPLAVFILFKKKIDEVISVIIVKPFFSYVSPSKWLFDIVIILACVAAGLYFIRKVLNGSKFPHK